MNLAIALAAAVLAPIAPSPSPSPTPPIPDPCLSLISLVTRPTVTTSVCAVRPGQVLIESGYTNTVTTGPGGGITASYPQSFVRVGTSLPHLELDVAPPSGNRSSIGSQTVEGASDVSFEAKYEAGYTAKALWGAGALVSVPTGSPAFTSGGTQYTFQANWGYTLSPVFGVAGTFGYNWLTGFAANGEVQRFSAFVPSVTFTASLPEASQLFVEDAYFTRAGLGLPAKNLIDAGVIHDFGPDIQFDAEYGFIPTPKRPASAVRRRRPVISDVAAA